MEKSNIKVFVILDKELLEIKDLNELIEVLKSSKEGKAIIIKGEILGILSFSKVESLIEVIKEKKNDMIPRIAAVLDQMFRGFSDILLREVKDVEVHEILGRGLESSVKIGDRLFRHPAKDDFDVLKIVESVAKDKDLVAFFTGDKSLANQASALKLENVKVYYMPPNEYPGKESLVKAMISVLNKLKNTKL